MSTLQRSATDDPAVVRESATTLPLPARHVSWGAVLAGMVIAVVVHLVLSLVGAGVGLGAFDPLGYGSPDATTFGISAGIWWAVSSAVALFLGGWVAGHLCGSLEKTDAVLHGLLTWGLGTIVTVYLVTAMVGSVVRGGAAVVGKTAELATSSVTAASGPAAEAIRDATPPGTSAVDSLGAQLAQRRAEAGSRARQVADAAASASSKAALAAAGALVLGAIAGALGGLAGRRRPRRFVAASASAVRS
ncbi:MAG TPA: hypothetical protein VHM00_03585 [Caldimonas sp.]|jgi:hypothetical protein|nr:hypothetical protein [Caldimonas sp.]HEX2540146.1 hypothetical protein [Caldimonas sp.]